MIDEKRFWRSSAAIAIRSKERCQQDASLPHGLVDSQNARSLPFPQCVIACPDHLDGWSSVAASWACKSPPISGTIFYTSKTRNWRRLERLTVKRWLRRWSGNGVFEKIWHPLRQAKLGEVYKQTSASFI